MNWSKLDAVWKGIIIGIVFPLLMFVFYWLIFHHQLSFPRGFYRYLRGGNLLSNVIKVCAIGNLGLFYLGLTKKIDKFSKGIIFSVLLYVALVAYVSYYLETEYS